MQLGRSLHSLKAYNYSMLDADFRMPVRCFEPTRTVKSEPPMELATLKKPTKQAKRDAKKVKPQSAVNPELSCEACHERPCVQACADCADLQKRLSLLQNTNAELLRLVDTLQHQVAMLTQRNTKVADDSAAKKIKSATDDDTAKKIKAYKDELKGAQKTITALRAEHQAELKPLTAELVDYDKRICRLQVEYESKLDKLQTAHGAQIDKLQNAHDAQMDKLQTAHDAQIGKLQVELSGKTELTATDETQRLKAELANAHGVVQELVEMCSDHKHLLGTVHDMLRVTSERLPSHLKHCMLDTQRSLRTAMDRIDFD
jgi:chromosome segregation ATPase